MNRTFTTFLICILFLIGIFKANAQERNILNENYQEDSLINILKSFENTYKVRFAYDVDLLLNKLVTVTIENESLEDAITRLTDIAGLDVEIINEIYVIKPSIEIKHKTLRGKVIDKETNESLPNSNIYIKGTRFVSTSNPDGFFSFTKLKEDSITVVVEYLGYKKKEIYLNRLVADSVIIIELDSKSEILQEIVVEDEENENARISNDVSHVSINPQKLKFLPTYGERDIFRMIQLLPGVSATSEISSGLVIRGGTPDQNLVTFDGYSLYHIDHFYGVFSAFNSDAIKNIQIYKSGMQAKYGGRVGGYIDIIGKSGNKNNLSGRVGMNFMTANAMLEAPLGKKVTLFVAARRSHTDLIQSNFYNKLAQNVISEGANENKTQSKEEDIIPDFHFYDLNGKITYSPSVKDVLTLSYYKGADDLKLGFEDDFIEERPQGGNVLIENKFQYQYKMESDWGNVGYGVKWGRQWNNKWYTTLLAGQSKYYSNINFSEEYYYSSQFLDSTFISNEKYRYVFSQKNVVKDNSLKLNTEWLANNFNKVNVGFSATKNIINLENGDNLELFIETQKGEQYSAYVQDEITLSKEVTATIGARGSYYSVLDKFYFEPKVMLSYQPYEKLLFKGAWAANNQAINRIIRQEVYSNNPDFWILANEDLPVVNSNTLVLGSTYRGKYLTVDLEGYYKRTNGIVEYLQKVGNIRSEADGGQLISNIAPEYFQGLNYSKGVEVLVNGNVGEFGGWLSYTLSKSENKFDDVNNGNIFPSQNDQRHELKLTGMVSLGKWQLSSTFVYGSGRPYTSPIGEYTLTLPDSTQVKLIDKSINSSRLPDYHRLDISANYKLTIRKVKTQLGLSLLNVYNRSNVKYKKLVPIYLNEETGELYDKPEYRLINVNLLGFTPNVYLSFEF